jgi:hypothetical protein
MWIAGLGTEHWTSRVRRTDAAHSIAGLVQTCMLCDHSVSRVEVPLDMGGKRVSD